MKQIELLAPAKNLEYGIIAIKCGADAVYIGAPKFGARSSAGNNLEDIEKLVQFAHFYKAKVYVTVNTILYDNEIEQAQRLIVKLYNIGVDAIIIQDMGLLELELPPIKLIASTQCHNNTPEKIKFLEQVGFSRVILARELSLKQIEEIRSQTNIELESFVHGALCVSYSGQCYMSYALGGRSGNRGECAQPCRKKYSLIDTNDKIISNSSHLLSLKDMNRSEYLKDLINCGITSFKIEGRLKDINYLKNIVTFYRNKIDEVIDGTEYKQSSGGKIITSIEANPLKTFNRGYTNYFLNERNEKITTFDTPKFKGEKIGKIVSISKDSFVIDKNPDITLHNGDGICFFNKSKDLCGTVLNKAENNRIFPDKMENLSINTIIYRNLDHEFIKKLNQYEPERKISVNFYLFESQKDIFLTAIDEDSIESTEIITYKKEIADNPEMALDNIKKQLAKLGETDFVCSNIDINLDKTYFIRVKDLNNARRNLIEKLKQNRMKSYERQEKKIKLNDFAYPTNELTFEGNVLNKYAKQFYLKHGIKTIEPAAESGLIMKNRKLMTTKHCLKYQFDLCPKQKPKSDFKEPFYLVDEHNKKYLLKFNCKNCEMEIYF
jgi:putative protease